MKKIFSILMLMTLTCSVSFGANAYTNAIKQDIKNTKNDIKSAVKQDVQTKVQASTNTATVKREEKIKQLDKTINGLNDELLRIKNDNTLTQTEKTLKSKGIEHQINFYKKQKAALK